MKKYTFLLLLLSQALKMVAQGNINYNTQSSEMAIVRNGLNLSFSNNSPNFSPIVQKRLIDAFFEVYPKEVKRFNLNAATVVTFEIDTAYKGVAETLNGHVKFNPDWFRKHPEDIDVVTHELMHVVQSYGNNQVPGWLTEGIADYARYTFGINNEAAGWQLTPFKPGQNYTNAYRITARFLVWVEKRRQLPKLVTQLDKAMRADEYKPELWKILTGKTVDELWADYASNPVI